MGLFHKTIMDAVKIAETDPAQAIKILEKHEKKAEKIYIELGEIKISNTLHDYYETVADLCGAIERKDKRNIRGWINHIKYDLRKLQKAAILLREYTELE